MAELHLISIVVEEMAPALRFYRRLGMKIPPGAAEEPHVEALTPGGLRVAWDTRELMESIHGEWVEPVGHRAVLAFECGSPEEVDELYREIVQAGYEGFKEPWDAFWGQRYAVVVDPDGSLVDLYAGLPPEEEGGAR